MNSRGDTENPLRRLEDWEDFVEARYPAPGEKPRQDYRNYDNPARDTVRGRAAQQSLGKWVSDGSNSLSAFMRRRA